MAQRQYGDSFVGPGYIKGRNPNCGKVTYTSAENDLVLYDTQRKKVVAVGKVKANYYDIPHADYQLRRNRLMLTGQLNDATPDQSSPTEGCGQCPRLRVARLGFPGWASAATGPWLRICRSSNLKGSSSSL